MLVSDVKVGEFVTWKDDANAGLLAHNLGVIIEIDEVVERIRVGMPNIFGTVSTTSVWPEQFERLLEVTHRVV